MHQEPVLQNITMGHRAPAVPIRDREMTGMAGITRAKDRKEARGVITIIQKDVLISREQGRIRVKDRKEKGLPEHKVLNHRVQTDLLIRGRGRIRDRDRTEKDLPEHRGLNHRVLMHRGLKGKELMHKAKILLTAREIRIIRTALMAETVHRANTASRAREMGQGRRETEKAVTRDIQEAAAVLMEIILMVITIRDNITGTTMVVPVRASITETMTAPARVSITGITTAPVRVSITGIITVLARVSITGIIMVPVRDNITETAITRTGRPETVREDLILEGEDHPETETEAEASVRASMAETLRTAAMASLPALTDSAA